VSETGYAGAAAPTGTGPIVTQVYGNQACVAQNGGGKIAWPAVIDLDESGPALLCWQASAWTQGAPNGAKLQPVINNHADSTLGTAVFYNDSAMHLPMLRRRALVQPLPVGESMIAVMATANAITDSNDSVNMALVDFSDMAAPPQVRYSGWGTALGAGPQYTWQVFAGEGGPLVISVAASAWSGVANNLTGAILYMDGQPIAFLQLFANVAGIHLPLVGADVVVQAGAGGHTLNLVAAQGTAVDSNDVWSLNVMELQAGTTAAQLLDNTPCQTQSGGGTIASAPYTAGGGVQLLCLNVSGYSATENTMLHAHVLVDGNPVGTVQLFANSAEMHLPLCGGDLAPGSIPVGDHVISVVADDTLVTDGNDRCSLTVVEFAS
jgi:hypothetical protein